MTMKNALFALLVGTFLWSSCGDDTREEIEVPVPEVAKDSLSTIEGEFIYLADAAILKGPDFIYGVELDSIAMDLAERVAPLKEDDFDMTSVKVRAKILKNRRPEGWDEVVEIREILEIQEEKEDSVAAPTDNKKIDKP